MFTVPRLCRGVYPRVVQPIDATVGEGVPPVASAVGVLSDSGLRVLIDSEVLAQAVYLYRPVFGDDGSVVDLEVVMMNAAAHRVPLSSHVREGVLASDVFVDTTKATEAATLAWRGGRAQRYEIERRGFVAGQPVVVRYEVSTFRMGGYIVQVSVDHSTVVQLASADARFRLMADASLDGLVLLARDADSDELVVVYANPAAFAESPLLRVGRRLPAELEEVALGALVNLADGSPVHRLVGVAGVSRKVDAEISFATVAEGQVMMAIRRVTPEKAAAADLERSERVLAAIGAGAFGMIVVLEPRFVAGRLAGLDLVWRSPVDSGGANRRSDLDPTEVIPVADLLDMATAMLDVGQHQRSGWVQFTGPDGRERSVEFTLVLAGDRFVLECVERTEELAARTAFAMVTATSEAQRSFLSRVSHELRSPLNVIHGYSQLLGRLQLPSAAVDHVERIEAGVERMVQIVDDLLLLGQLDQGLLRIDDQLVDLGEIAADVVTSSASQPWSRAGSVRVAEGRAEATVRTDRSRLVTIGLLLVEASIASCFGDALEVGPFVRGAKAGLQLTAPSTCPVVDEVWQPFASGHLVPGAGLSLAVARGLVQALGITLEVRAAEGRSALLLLLDPVGEPIAATRGDGG